MRATYRREAPSRILLSHRDRAHRDVGASVDGLGRGVNHRARERTPAASTRSAYLRTCINNVLARFGVRVLRPLHGCSIGQEDEGADELVGPGVAKAEILAKEFYASSCQEL
jgi:hypothetical protein